MSSTEAHAAPPNARLIRHAQASWGSADYDRLSPLGETQARHLGEWLAADAASFYAGVIRGSLRRHAQTLQAIEAAFAAAGRVLPAAIVDPGWNEFEHEPLLRAYAAAFADDPNLASAVTGDVRAQRAVLVAAVKAWREGLLDAEVAETWSAFGARVAAARARIASAGERVLIVTSGGPMWRCAQAALGVDDSGLARLDLALRNTGISDFRHDNPRWTMLSWNEVPHLSRVEHLHTHY